jgi:glucose-1-phosphate thymidylyltransferase
VYLFSPLILDASKRLEPSDRGELEITEAIQTLIDEGRDVRSEVVNGWWKDTGQLADMLEANRLVLEDIETRLDGEVHDSRVEGRVILEEGAVLKDSLVRGPAVIGRGAVVEGAYIGPYTSIGDGVKVLNSEIEHSILLAGSSVENLGSRIEASLLGREVRVTRSDSLPKTMRLLVGDRAEIEIV